MSAFDEHDLHIVRSNKGRGETLADIMQRRISRRTFLRGTATTSVVALTACAPSPSETVDAPTDAPAEPTEPTEGEPTVAPTEAVAEATVAPAVEASASGLTFTAIDPRPNTEAQTAVAAGYTVATLLRWGDPLTADAPEFDPENQTPAAQAQQFGYNCDFVGFLPLPQGSTASDQGLLVVNHEYTNPEIMFPGYLDASQEEPTANTSQEIVDTEIEAHGVSVVEISQDADGVWSYNRNSEFNRRLTGTTPTIMSGPAADHEWLKTSADESGTNILGTLNNCAAGKTPWGTVVTAEENFHQYFGNLALLTDDDPRKEVHDRYGIPEEASERLWENFRERFDVSKEPNEAFRFGWAVEVDPYDPTMTPVKRTWLGRFRHEAQTFVVTPSNKVVVYTGDDARFEYVYKFVSSGDYSPDDRAANMSLLDDGMLYVAVFNDDGSGEWLPLEFGTGPLTEENGFTSQGDVLIKTRLAADLLGATKMDRPEDIETNPVNQKVYIALTNNTNRAVDDNPGTDAANPRPENAYGHIIELTEDGDDHTATSFAWDIFMLCGDPSDETTFFADFPKEQVSPIANPDNITFDIAGNLWIATDGQPGTLEYNDGLFAVPVDGPERGYLRQFFSSVVGSEVCGPEFTPDNTTLFLAIQHPGEGGTFEEQITSGLTSLVHRARVSSSSRRKIVAQLVQPDTSGAEKTTR